METRRSSSPEGTRLLSSVCRTLAVSFALLIAISCNSGNDASPEPGPSPVLETPDEATTDTSVSDTTIPDVETPETADGTTIDTNPLRTP